MLAIWRIVARRSLANWRMLAVLGLGVLVAATLLASAPIYARAMADLGLTFTIRDELEGRTGARAQFPDIALQTDDGRALRAAIERRIDERVGWFRGDQSRALRLGRFPIARPGEAPQPRAPLGQPHAITGYEDHVRVVEGRLPAATAGGAPLEVALSPRALQLAGLKVGDRFDLGEDFDTCARELPRDDRPPPPPCTPVAGLRFAVPAQLVGVVEPLDPEDPFWVIGANSYFDPERLIPDAGPILPLLAEESSLLEAFGGRYPGYRAAVAWHAFADPERLTRTNFERARTDLRALYEELAPLGGFAFSPLANTLDGFGRSARYQQTPLTVLLLEIACIALFYVALVSAVVVERQAGEIALLRSRGASVWQITAISLLEGLIVGVPALLLAPFLAAAATALLGLTPAFREVSDGRLLPVTIPPLAYLLAAGGVLLSLLALALPAALSARRHATAQRRAEGRPGVSILQRYYLDLILAGFAGLLLWELRERGSLFTPSATGGVSSDPVLLLSPALIIAAAAALVIRLYPLLLRLAARLLAPGSGPTVAVGLWQVVRSPGQYTRLTLLLMMAVAVGTFAASYSVTAERAYRDRAAYQTGVDLRAGSRGDSSLDGTAADVDARASAISGVSRASAVVRAGGTLGTQGTSTREVQIVGVDPPAAGQMLWFRDDFAERPLADLLTELEGSALRGMPLPGAPAEISVWLDTAEPRPNVTAWARVRGGNGLYSLLELGRLDQPGWREFRSPILPRYGPPLTPPFTLISLVLTEGSNTVNTSSAPVFVDDIAVIDAAGVRTPVEDFEGTLAWAPLPSRSQLQDAFTVSSERAHAGRSAGRFAFRTGPAAGVRGIHVQDPAVPLPALVSDDFVRSTGLGPGAATLIQVGDALVPIQIRDTFRLFPTLEAGGGPGIILNRDQLIAWANTFTDSGLRAPNEVWFSLAPDADREQIAATLAGYDWRLRDVLDREAALRSIESNPLIAAGGSGILLLAFVAVLALVAAALLVSLWMAVQRRRVEFAVLRALGLSRGQVLRLLALEYAIVAVVGLVVGAYLGLLVGRRMLSFLNVTENGGRVVPAFILHTDWAYVAAGGGTVLLIFAAALLLATRVLARSSDAAALRTE